VGTINDLPVTGDTAMSGAFAVEGRPLENWSNAPVADRKFVSPNYFAAIGIPIRRGRVFVEHDRPGAEAPLVINEALARRHFPGEDPVGKRLVVPGIPSGIPVAHEIVGVVADARQHGLRLAATPEIYFSSRQFPYDFEITLVARTDPGTDAARLAAPLRLAVSSVDPAAPVFRVRTMDEVMAEAVAQERFSTIVTGGFALIALLLAAVGLYGVMAYFVAQRRHELGVRAALGAQARDLLALIIREGMKVTLIAVAIGAGAGMLAGRALDRLSSAVNTGHQPTWVAAALLLICAALLASYLPARRATRIDPLSALREE
jgi:putative ABC transport system permease protein